MSQERKLGLQWRLALICFTAGTAGSMAALAAIYIAEFYSLTRPVSLFISLSAGLFVGLGASVAASVMTRSFKLRLWEAGRMAGRIAGGDYQARLETGPDDEVGWLEVQLNQMASQLETAVGSLRELAEQNRLLAEEAGRGAALEERMRLARDLHDTVNQQLFVLAMRNAAVRRKLENPGENINLLLSEIKSLEKLASEAHSQIRELILELRPVTLENEGLGPALIDYIRSAADRDGWQVRLAIDENLKPGKALGESYFRIAQETFNNISKHSGANQVEVTLKAEGDDLIMVITDNGTGFDLKKSVRPTSVGLSGIKERAASVMGEAEIISAPGNGTKIIVAAPLNGEGKDS